MELAKFIQKDIEEFLVQQEERDIKVGNVRDDELAIYDVDRDYVKELDEKLQTHNLASAKDIFDELRLSFNRTSDTHSSKKKIYNILKDMYSHLNKYIVEHKVQNALTADLDKYRQHFEGGQLPSKILSDYEKELQRKKARSAGEGYNLLKSDAFKQKSAGKSSAKELSKEISNNIPLENSNQLHGVLGKEGPTIIEHQTIVERGDGNQAGQNSPQYPQQSSNQQHIQPQNNQQYTPPQGHQPQYMQQQNQQYIQPQQTQPYVQQMPNPMGSQGGISPQLIQQIVNTVTNEVMSRNQSQDRDRIKEQIEQRLTDHPQKLDEIMKEPGITDNLVKEMQEIIQEQKAIEDERRRMLHEEQEIQHKLKDLKKINLASRKKQVEDAKRKHSIELDILKDIAGYMSKISMALGDENVAEAKRQYALLKKEFSGFPKSKDKKRIFKEILDVYNQIRFAEKNAEDKDVKKVMDRLKRLLVQAKKQVVHGDIDSAMTLINSGKHIASVIEDKRTRKYAFAVLQKYSDKINTIRNKNHPRQESIADMYMEGVRLLYSGKKEEAATLFKKILDRNPANIAAKMRLKEAS